MFTRWLFVLACLLLSTARTHAAEMTLTLQRGLDGYDGVEDTFLYAPASVADINFGAYASLNAGINRWREYYVTLIRFDLSDVPPAAKVTAASLRLCRTSKEWPTRDVAVDIQAVAPANADWSEGSGEGERVPVEGTTCWSARRYGVAKWAGETGLRKEGADTLAAPLATVTLKQGEEGWVEFPLRIEGVQAWVADPKANAGMRIYPLAAREAGDVANFHSSDVVKDPSLRPKLVLRLEMDDATAQDFRRRRATRAAERLVGFLGKTRTVITEAGSPPRAVQGLRAVETKLAALREEARAAALPDESALGQILAKVTAVEAEIGAVPGQLTLALAAAANERRGLPTAFALGVADSMANVLRSPGEFRGSFPETAELELARNETECVQLVIVPVDRDVQGATWSVSALKGPGRAGIPASDVTVAVMGYLKSRKPAVPTNVEWWPGPILDFMRKVDVARGEVQPLWVSVRTREKTPPGIYTGTLSVKAPGAGTQRIGLRVRVYDFTVPKEQHLLTVWGNNEPTYVKLYGKRYDKRMARRMFDFLLDHRLAVNTLYAAQAAGKPAGEGWFTECIGYPTLSDPKELKRLWDAGSRWWNLGYLHPVHAKSAGMEFEAYVPKFIEMTRESLKVADAAGWPHANLGIYFFDETKDFETLNKAAAQVKAAFPDIALMTTGYDRSYGVKSGPIDRSIDIWCPLTPRFAEDQEVIAEGRTLGKKAWWYVCCGPTGKHLNFFSQLPAVRSRLLMGAATWRYQPDGFLYYRISGWSHYKKPIDGGPLTDWTPYFLPGPDGDGELICPGPDGPLSTLPFENLRDGIEDYEYLWVLRDRVERARARGLDVSKEAALLEIPPDVLTSLTQYTEDSTSLLAWRRAIAEAIERLDGRQK